jgi:hypothetical protein
MEPLFGVAGTLGAVWRSHPDMHSLGQAYSLSDMPWPTTLPVPLRTTFIALDAALDRLADLAMGILRLSAERAASPLELLDSPPDGIARQLAQLHQDSWLAVAVDGGRAATRLEAAAAQNLAIGLTAALDRVPVRSEPVQTRLKDLLDVLALPTWDLRHELYSATTAPRWVSRSSIGSRGLGTTI